jgi:hypothetical protein
MTPMRDSATLFKLSDDVRYRVIDNEAVLLRLEAGKVHALNEVGARILDLIDGNRPLGEILATLSREYEVGLEELEADVIRFLETLLDGGVVEEVSGS